MYFDCIAQASRVLKMERYSLLHLLQHFCGVTANKEYAVFFTYSLLSFHYIKKIFHFFGMAIAFVLTLYS
jgi:hypothetical protein